MVTIDKPPAGDGNADRLARAAAMVTDAVALLNSAIAEIQGHPEHGDDDDRDAARAPDRKPEQPR